MSRDEPPIACTLSASERPDRITEWQTVLAGVRARSTTADGRLRLEFDDVVDARTVAELMAAEQSCSAFFAFTLTIDARRTALEVGAPPDAGEIVAAVFGSS